MILIIDDDIAICHSLELLLKQAGFATISAAEPSAALIHLDRPDLELVLQDMNFSRQTTGEEGLELLAEIKKRRPELPVILITAWGSIELAVQGMQAGASDFITKPWNNDQVVQSVSTALNLVASGARNKSQPSPTRDILDERFDFGGVLGRDPEFLRVLDLAGRVASSDASVLITGDSGTGKEVVAAALHRNSPRSQSAFVKVNLGGIPSTLFESEMFGHVRGAFTDAKRDRTGRFQRANGGTIFLDEIGELDQRSQVKLLRVLQDRTYEVLGSSISNTLDIRVISATNCNLPKAVKEGTFREDLLYRLNLITLRLPGLSERSSDIPLLARHFLTRAAVSYGKTSALPMITSKALAWLSEQSWPGNVRQLEHFLARAVLILESPALDVEDCVRVLAMEEAGEDQLSLPPVGSMTVDQVEKAMITRSLQHHAGNISKASESLGLSRAGLYRRLEKYGIGA